MAKIQFLTYEIHLTDAAQVAQLQGNPPGESSAVGAIIRAPYNPGPPAGGAAVEFGTTDVPVLPMVGPLQTVNAPCLYSEWFVSTNNFPRDVATFVRKSGGWFGIPLLFGTTTRFFWRGVFVYTPAKVTTTPAGGTRAPIQQRRWIDYGGPLQDVSQGDTFGGGVQASHYGMETRAAGRTVDGVGVAIRGQGVVRSHKVTDYSGGGLSPELSSWERIYVRLKHLPLAEAHWWRAYSNNGGTEQPNGWALGISPSGQIVVYNVDSAAAYTVLGTTTPLTLNKFYKVDLLMTFGTGGTVSVYLNGSLAITISGAPPATGGFNSAGLKHERSKLGQDSGLADPNLELDIAFWMNAARPATLDGIDWLNGSKAVLVRANGFAAGHANWTGDWRQLSQIPVQRNITGNALSSTTALAELQATTDAAQSVDAIPNSVGVAAFMVIAWSHRGTTSGQFGYKIGAAARVMAALTQAPTASNNGAWNSMMYRPAGNVLPAAITPLEIHHQKGNDATIGRVVHLSAIVEVLGTFGVEDYDPSLPAELKYPLPYLGPHNAPYPRTPWARSATPPFSPVVIVSGSYTADANARNLLFRCPLHWFWLRRTSSGTPKGVRWWSSRLGAGVGNDRTTIASVMPDEGMNDSFSTASTDTPPTGVGALPNRADQVATIVDANASLLDGNEDHKRDLLGVIIRQLNVDNPGDGNNWGFLIKNDRTPPFVPADIVVWLPTLDHVDVLTDTGASWIPKGVINAAWAWLAAKAEGQQEQQSLIRISGSDPESNQAGETYAYTALCDPGGRFIRNGACALHIDGSNLPQVVPLDDAKFTPIVGFLMDDRGGGYGDDTVARMMFKGTGSALASVTNLAGSVLANSYTLGAGSVTIATAAFLVDGTPDGRKAYAFFRREDGSADPGRYRVVQMLHYDGDGGGARTIALMPASLRRPLFALVAPDNAVAFYKDAFHTGGNSSNMTGSQVATAITGGDIDQLTVGATLNANGVRYNVFVICGGTTACNDGFSCPGEFIPVEPDWIPGIEDEPGAGGAGGGIGDDQPPPVNADDDDMAGDLSPACVKHTTRIVNIALSRIGVSKQVAALATELTQEAIVARLHWAKDVEATLRDFPWPFATRYATLALLGGSPTAPVNGDWTYSYRRPSDCIFERRIVVPRTGAVDPTPPPFQLSNDDTGGRIFTNQATARLEYTGRPSCTAGRGDPLFRDALAWKLASNFAGPLTRMADVVKHCRDEYEAAIAKAQLVLKPGNPGPRTAVDPDALDTGTGCAAANLALVNRALLRIGAQTIANLDTEQSREAEAARIIFEDELRSTLRDFPWGFCKKYTNALTFVAGTPAAPANNDWTFAYRYPSDCVFVRRIVSATKRAYDPQPPQFGIGQDGTGDLIFTDTENPPIEYTARIPCAVGRADALFRDAFAWRLAASLAPSLAQVDPDAIEQQGRGPQDRPRERKATEAQLRERVARYAWGMYSLAINTAKTSAAQEQQPDPTAGDADWIAGRN